MRLRLYAFPFGALLAVACTRRDSKLDDSTASTAFNCISAKAVVAQFGERLRDVSLLAPAPDLERAIRDAYGPFATPALVDQWLAAPTTAPGRRVSSPWPDHIVIDSIAPADSGSCEVQGRVVYVTSADSVSGRSVREDSVMLRVEHATQWRIAEYRDAPTEGSDEDAAADVLRRYYAAIDRHDFRAAYTLWGNNGAASGQSFEEFRAGYSAVAHDSVFVDRIGRVEGAAGSRYVELAVRVHAVTTNGTLQRFTGTYTLRRVVVDGATDAQRRWHLESATLHTDAE